MAASTRLTSIRQVSGSDIHEHGPGAGHGDGGDGGDRGVRHRDDLVAGADAARHQRQGDGFGARGAADAMPHTQVGGEGLLEAIQFLAQDEPAAAQHALHGGVKFCLELQVFSLQIAEFDLHVILL